MSAVKNTDWRADLRSLEEAPPPRPWPAQARETLLGILHEEQATDSEISLASKLLCEMPRTDDDWVHALLATVANRNLSEHDRARATIPLGPVLTAAHTEGFDDGHAPIAAAVYRDIQSTLYELYTDSSAPVRLRQQALVAFAHAPEARLETAVRAAYGTDEEWRVTALRCMFFHDGFESEVLESLPSKNLDIRAHAIRAAGPCELEQAWPPIRAVLSEPAGAYKPLLLAAIDSIGHIRPDEAEDLLRDLVSADDADVGRAATKALAFVRWPLLNYDLGDDVRRN